MLPIRIDVKTRGLPLITVFFIFLCTALYIVRFPQLIPGGVVPLDFVYSLLHPETGIVSSVFVLLASFFLHGSIIHLVGNMWYLWLFGSTLERHIGFRSFLPVYFLSGTAAMLTQIANDPLSTIPIIGASGAIAGVMGTYLILLPFTKIVFGLPPVFSFRLPAALFLLFWFWLQWSNVGTIQQTSCRIAWWAHIGGFCFGIAAGIVLRISSLPDPSPKKKNLKHRIAR